MQICKEKPLDGRKKTEKINMRVLSGSQYVNKHVILLRVEGSRENEKTTCLNWPLINSGKTFREAGRRAKYHAFNALRLLVSQKRGEKPV